MTPKPTALAVRAESIPVALTRERRWVCWRYTWDSERQDWSKVPHRVSGYQAKSNDSSTWTTFEEVVRAYRAGGFDGIGFVLGDGWAGIDLDRCLNPDGSPNDAGGPFIRMLNCYLERSPSGTGVKAIGRSALVGGEIKFHHDPLAFTTWKGARYVALTGHPMSHPYGDDPTMGITSLLEEWFPAKSGASVPTSLADRPSFIREGDTRGTDAITDADIYPPLSDDDVVARILASPQAAKFLKLCRGEISDYGDDRSKADQALVNILAYWCRRDVEQIDRLFRQSKLYRSKWEVRSYRLATINKAVRSWA